MDRSKLHGVQYVRLAPGAGERIAPYLNVPADEIQELILDLDDWPEEIQRAPLRARDGRLIEGDPVLLDVTETGLLFAGRSGGVEDGHPAAVLVSWERIESLQPLRRGHSQPLLHLREREAGLQLYVE